MESCRASPRARTRPLEHAFLYVHRTRLLLRPTSCFSVRAAANTLTRDRRASANMHLFRITVLLAVLHIAAPFFFATSSIQCSRHAPLRMQQRPIENLKVDLGADGEPKGMAPLQLRPMMPNSEFITLDLGLPLGMLIEVEDAGGGSAAGMWYQKTRVMVTDALPGYSSYRNVQKGDILRAVTAYARRLIYSSLLITQRSLPLFLLSRSLAGTRRCSSTRTRAASRSGSR